MHPAWRYSFKQFVADLPPRPGPEYSIHRIKNDGHYEPGNVKWATAKEQASNRRTRRDRGSIRKNSVWAGDTNLKEACRRARVPYTGVHAHINATDCTPLLAIGHFAQRRRLGLSPHSKLHIVDGLTLPEACRRAGVNHKSVRSRMKRRNESAQEALAHFADWKP
jgi:hypothetical protein